MKKLLFLFLLPLPAFANPHVYGDVITAVTQCGVLFNTDPKSFVPAVVESGAKVCKFDLAPIPVGSHSIRMTAIANDPMFGPLESAPSAPLAFVKPGAPSAPAGLRLVP